jgi:hypothetical protein
MALRKEFDEDMDTVIAKKNHVSVSKQFFRSRLKQFGKDFDSKIKRATSALDGPTINQQRISKSDFEETKYL